MYPGNQPPVGQPAQRHRRSDRYLQQDQVPAAPQSATSWPTPPVMPSSFQQERAPQGPQAAYTPQSQPPQQPVQHTTHRQRAVYTTQSQPPLQQASMRQPPYMTQSQQPLQPAGMQQSPYMTQSQQPLQPAGVQPPPYMTQSQQPLQPAGMQQPPYMTQSQQPLQHTMPQQSPYLPQSQQPGYGWNGPAQQPYQGQAYEPQRAGAGMAAGGYQGWRDPTPQASNPYEPERQPDMGGVQPLRRGWLGVVFALILVAAVIGGVIGIRSALETNRVRSYVSKYDDKFCEGVYVDGIHLGGMTQQEGINAVTTQAQQRSGSWYVRLTYQGQTVAEITAAQLGMRVDVIDVLREAWQQGHDSNDIYQRQEAMQALLETPYENYTATPSGDTSVVDSILEQLRDSAYRAPQDAAIIGFDPDKTYPFTFQDEVPGRVLNIATLKEEIYRMVSTMESGELEVVPEIIAPSVTVAQLQQSVALRADEYTEISTTSTDDRNKNIKRAFEKISGTVIGPGEVFSFNTVVGRRTVENGFFEALEYQYGNEVMGIGGGVCQASTTMYLAAVAANLEITKHTPHSMEVGYTSFGMDATVSWEGSRQVDFAFRNNSGGNIYICASVQYDPKISKHSVARVRIYGPYLGDGVRYKLIAYEIEELPQPEDEIRRDTKAQHVTYTDEEKVISKGRVGHVTESYKVKYVNGVEVERTFMFKDTYKPAPKIIYVGVTERWE